MKFPHLFEFMDLDQIPRSLRTTLREILECGNATPFRHYYRWAAEKTIQRAIEHRVKIVVELGAGTAPLTRLMTRDSRSNGIKFVVCDNNPDRQSYEALEKAHSDKVAAIYDPVNFANAHSWDSATMLVLSATLHHVPSSDRSRVIGAMTKSADRIIVFEPLRKTIPSLLFVFLSTVPAILLPILFARRRGTFRRIAWCWLVPVAPIMFWWDGIVSCLRQWSPDEWRKALEELPDRGRHASIDESLFCQMVSW